MQEETYEFDPSGRMCYHPDFHFSHGKRFSQEELEYICKFYGCDSTRNLSFAIGKTEHTIRSTINRLKKMPYQGYANKYEYYKNRGKFY